MTAEPTFTAGEIAAITGKTTRAIELRAMRESWDYIEENGKGRGGKTKKYPLAALPSDVQERVLIYNKDTNPDAVGQMAAMLPVLSAGAALKAVDMMMDMPTFSDQAPAMLTREKKRGRPSPEVMATMDKAGRDYAALCKDKVRVKMQIVHQALNMPRWWKKGRRSWIEKVAEDNNTSFQNVYRLIGKYQRGGAEALDHVKSNRGQTKVWSPEALTWWLGMALKKGHDHISLKAIYEEALVYEASRQGWAIGSYASAVDWVKKKATPQLLALQRGGVRALDNTLTPVLRDYSDLAPFDILCGDQHRFDFWVMDAQTGDVFRPEAFIWQDLRTRVIYGAAVARHYSSDTVGLAMRMGIKIFGLFDSVYTDHGKPEESKYIMQVRKELAGYNVQFRETVEYYNEIIAGEDPEEIQPLMRLPNQHIQAVVRNAKAKMQESTNNVLEMIMADKFRVPGHVKNLKADQEEQYMTDQRNEALALAGKLLTFEEFVLRFYLALDYYNRSHNHRGVKKEWRWDEKPDSYTPFNCLRMCWQDGWRPRYITDESLELVFLARVKDRTPRMGMIRYNNDDYESKELLTLPRGEKVDLRVDPNDPTFLAVFRNDQYLCTAWPVEYSSMRNLTLAQRKIMEKRKLRQAFIDQYRQLTSAVPDFIRYSEVPKEEKAAALIAEDRRKKAQERQEANRIVSKEELEEGVRNLEEMNRLPKAKTVAPRPLPPKPSSWTSKALRHEWCLKMDACGGELSEEDRKFVREYEAAMTPEERERWQFEREYNAMVAQGG